jgi:membrane-bound ClpP family serine protease
MNYVLMIDLLEPYKQQLQLITTILLTLALYKSQQRPLSLFQTAVFTSRFLATDL